MLTVHSGARVAWLLDLRHEIAYSESSESVQCVQIAIHNNTYNYLAPPKQHFPFLTISPKGICHKLFHRIESTPNLINKNTYILRNFLGRRISPFNARTMSSDVKLIWLFFCRSRKDGMFNEVIIPFEFGISSLRPISFTSHTENFTVRHLRKTGLVLRFKRIGSMKPKLKVLLNWHLFCVAKSG